MFPPCRSGTAQLCHSTWGRTRLGPPPGPTYSVLLSPCGLRVNVGFPSLLGGERGQGRAGFCALTRPSHGASATRAGDSSRHVLKSTCPCVCVLYGVKYARGGREATANAAPPRQRPLCGRRGREGPRRAGPAGRRPARRSVLSVERGDPGDPWVLSGRTARDQVLHLLVPPAGLSEMKLSSGYCISFHPRG